MPAAPELGDRARPIGQIEIARERKAEREAKPDRHVRVAGEIEIDLDRVGRKPEPGFGEARQRRLVEHGFGKARDLVGDQHLLRKTDDEDAQARRDAPEPHAPRAEAARNRVIADDRAGDELRKHRDVDRDLKQVAVGRCAAMHVDQVRDRVKGEERDAERQREAGQRERGTGDRVHRAEDKVGVLEQAEGGEVRRHRECRDEAAPVALRGTDHQGRCVVEDDLAGEQQDEDRLAPGVEQKRGRDENDVLRRDPGRHAINDEEQRQEIEQERDGREQHQARCTAFARLWPIAAPSWRSARLFSGNSSTMCARLNASRTVKPSA